MKSWLLHICFFAGCVLSLSSCAHDEVMDADTNDTSVELTLSYAGGDPISRDVASRDDADGLDYTTEAQCELTIDDIFILAFDETSDKLLGLVEDLELVEGSNYYTMKIKGRMRPQRTSTNVYFAVLTNLNQNVVLPSDYSTMTAYLKSKIGETSRAIYQSLIYTTTTGKWIINTDTDNKPVRIPMWGKTGSATLSNGALINQGCNLYRALAKVQIWMNGKNGIKGTENTGSEYEFRITSIVVNNVDNQGYCASLKTPSDDIKTQYTEVSIPTGGSKLTSVTYIPLDGLVEYEIEGSTEKQKLNAARQAYCDYIYLPEHLNNGSNGDITITINFKYNNVERIGTIYFKDYTTNKAWDVIRNHSYVFNIKSVNPALDASLALQYEVMDWTPVNNGDLFFGNADGDVTDDGTATN